MSGLEVAARPILEPLLRGDKHEISPEHQNVLVQWLTLKLMVLDAHSAQTFTAEERLAFFERREIPDGLNLSIFTTLTSLHGYHRSSCIFSPKTVIVPIENEIGNTHTASWFLGHFGVFATYNRGELIDFAIPPHIARRMTGIFPTIGHSLTWPPRRNLGNREDYAALERVLIDTTKKVGAQLFAHRTKVPLKVVEGAPGDSVLVGNPGHFFVGNEMADLICGSCQTELTYGVSVDAILELIWVSFRFCIQCPKCNSLNYIPTKVADFDAAVA